MGSWEVPFVYKPSSVCAYYTWFVVEFTGVRRAVYVTANYATHGNESCFLCLADIDRIVGFFPHRFFFHYGFDTCLLDWLNCRPILCRRLEHNRERSFWAMEIREQQHWWNVERYFLLVTNTNKQVPHKQGRMQVNTRQQNVRIIHTIMFFVLFLFYNYS